VSQVVYLLIKLYFIRN